MKSRVRRGKARDSLSFGLSAGLHEPTRRDIGPQLPFDFSRCLEELEQRVEAQNLSADLVYLASEIAALEPRLDPKDRLALLVLVLVTIISVRRGSTRFMVDCESSLTQAVSELCGPAFEEAGLKDLPKKIKRLLHDGGKLKVVGLDQDDYKPLLYFPPHIYHQRIYRTECALAGDVAKLLKNEPLEIDETALQVALEDLGNLPLKVEGKTVALSDEQMAAVTAAARSRLTIVSGGPGTGKTFIVASLIRLLVRLGVKCEEIALAAPTGKAANRMEESLRRALQAIESLSPTDSLMLKRLPQPQTLHRLLGYSSSRRRFNHHRNNRLGFSVVIVDEVSMVDLTLMERLVGALGPNCRLILLGDTDQLPSVSAGAVLRDLLSVVESIAQANPGASTAGAIRLSKSFRHHADDTSTRAISIFAEAIKRGDTEVLENKADTSGLAVLRRSSPEELSYSGVELLENTPQNIQQFVDRWFRERIQGSNELQRLKAKVFRQTDDGTIAPEDQSEMKELFDHVSRALIVCVTRVFATGSEALNEVFHERVARTKLTAPSLGRFEPGEPIIVTRNDYDRELFNGDQGVVIRARHQAGAKPFLAAAFPFGSSFRAFPLNTIEDSIELSYAITAHKAQGSEYEMVALLLPMNDMPLLTRELIYTAVTRARRAIVIVGDLLLLRTAIARKIERSSGLGERVLLELNNQSAQH